MTLKKLDDGIFVDTAKIDKIKSLDCIIFDCDGVLIDVSNSYDLAIEKTTDFMVKEFAKIEQSNFVSTQMIDGFKATGGFNDEVDVTYAMILSIVAANKLKKPFSEFIFDVIKNSDQSGIQSVEKYIDTLKVDLSEIRKKLAYPGPRYTNVLSSIFDEIFYGTELYYNLYKKNPNFFDGKGLIENDIVLVKKQLIELLKEKFGKKLAYLDALGFTLYMLLFIAGLVTFAYATLKLERGEIYYLLLGTSLLVVVSSSAKFITFRLLAVFLLTFVAYHYYCAWRENKNKRILYVFLATALLLLSSITFIFAPHYYQAYVIGHLLEFGAYLCMLFTLVKSLKR